MLYFITVMRHCFPFLSISKVLLGSAVMENGILRLFLGFPDSALGVS